MTTEEKLKHFNTVILESTQSQCDMELEEYKAGLNKYFEEHKEEAIKQKKLEESIEADRIRRKASREYTTEQLHIRRNINLKQEEIKEKLLSEIKELLKEFFETEDYKRLLIKQINEAKKVARGEAIAIYIDARDEKLKPELERATGEELIADGRSFLGGIKAEIPNKNILIDNSFESKLESWMENYLMEP
ncbi:MAG: V-type ATP synthase subunit E [Lachnospiraceae bacterium]